MPKNGTGPEIAKTRNILITQPKPESERSPYFDLAKRFGIELTFHPFIILDPIHAKEFRRQKIDITSYSAIIFTSRNAIEHFFRTCEELKISVSQDTKYFCISEAVALFLQKFIQYRKRKVFFGADGTNKSLFDVFAKHKDHERFLYVCSENQQDNEIETWMKAHECSYELAFMYRSVSNNIREIMDSHNFDMICFFTPSGVRSLLDNYPGFAQNGKLLGAFGNNTIKAIEEAGLKVEVKAPAPNSPSMITALEQFLSKK